MKIYDQIIKDGDLCFDIGANSGNKTQELLDHGAMVVCIEPQTSVFNNLKIRFLNNENTKILNYAIGAKNGKSIIFLSRQNTLSSMSESFINETSKQRFRGVEWSEKENVNVITLDNLISEYGCPNFCKIDVEGYETEVIRGLTKPIPVISIEFVPELKNNALECIKLLKNICNCKFNYSEQETMLFHFEDWVEEDVIVEFLESKNDFKVSFGDLYIKMY